MKNILSRLLAGALLGELLLGVALAAQLTASEVIRLKEMGFPEDEIRAEAARRGEPAALGDADLAALREAGISDALIEFLRNPAAAPAPAEAPPPVPAAGPEVPTPAAAPGAAPPEAPPAAGGSGEESMPPAVGAPPVAPPPVAEQPAPPAPPPPPIGQPMPPPAPPPVGEQPSPPPAPPPVVREPMPPPAPPPALPPTPAGPPPELVARVQEYLNLLGYEAGSPDGVLGRRTREAIRAYQRDQGLAPDGQPSEALVASLRSQLQQGRRPPAPTPTPGPGPAAGLVGSWEATVTDNYGNSMELLLDMFPDGTFNSVTIGQGAYAEAQGVYEVRGDRLYTRNQYGQSAVYRFQLRGDRLEMDMPNIGGTVTYIRQAE